MKRRHYRDFTVECEGNHEQLLRYLTYKLSPVLLGVKPSMLLRITNCNKAMLMDKYNMFCLSQEKIIKQLQLECFIFERNQNSLLALFYDPESLCNTIQNNKIQNFLSNFGYSVNKSLREHLEYMKQRFETNAFPHEIGLFLGYPLKDVKGFVENRDSLATASLKCGWKVYEPPAESLQLKELHILANDIVGHTLCEYLDINNCINIICNYKKCIKASKCKHNCCLELYQRYKSA